MWNLTIMSLLYGMIHSVHQPSFGVRFATFICIQNGFKFGLEVRVTDGKEEMSRPSLSSSRTLALRLSRNSPPCNVLNLVYTIGKGPCTTDLHLFLSCTIFQNIYESIMENVTIGLSLIIYCIRVTSIKTVLILFGSYS